MKLSDSIKLAWLNVFRHKRRTILTFSAMAIGLALLIVFDGMLSGFARESEINFINFDKSHIKIMSADYKWADKALYLDATISNENLAQSIMELSPAVSGVTRRIIASALITDGIDDRQGQVIGIDPQTYSDVYKLADTMVTSNSLLAMWPAASPTVRRKIISYLNTYDTAPISWNSLDYQTINSVIDGINAEADAADTLTLNWRPAPVQLVTNGRFLVAQDTRAALIGLNLAQKFNVGVGKKIELICKTKDGMYQSMNLDIVGVYKSGEPTLDGYTVIIPLSLAQDETMGFNMPGQVTEYDIRLRNGRTKNVLAATKLIAAAYPQYQVKSWIDLSQEYFAVASGKRLSTSIMFSIMVIVAALGVSNTILLSVYERINEIGMLMAMGMGRKKIRQLFLFEGAIIGMFGGIAGCVFGLLINIPLAIWGINFDSFGFDNADIGYVFSGSVRNIINPGTILFGFLLGALISVIMSVLPSYRATQLQPTEALRKI